MAKLARTRVATVAAGNFPNDLFMMALLYLVFRGTISILVAPLGGVNLNTESLKVGFRFQSIRETDCGRASSARLVITTLRGKRLAAGGDPDLPVDLALAKCVVVAEIVVDEILPGIHRRLDLVERCRRRTEEEEIRQRHLDAKPLLQLVDQFADRFGELHRRVILLRGRIEGDRLAVVDDLALGTGALHQWRVSCSGARHPSWPSPCAAASGRRPERARRSPRSPPGSASATAGTPPCP